MIGEGDVAKMHSELSSLEVELARILRDGNLQGELGAAAHYSVFPAGKRIRPQLAFALANDLHCNAQSLMTAAAGIELLHSSSLIHDDLPALDNDDERRGRPSCHKKFGEAVALLTGNALYSVALQAVSSHDGRFAQSLSHAFTELNNGQYLDIAQAAKDPAAVLNLFRQKTGALFGAACEVAVIANGGNETQQVLAKDFGVALGVLFQVGDDIQDDTDGDGARQIFSHVKEDLFRKFSLLSDTFGALPQTEAFVGKLLSDIEKAL